MKDKIQAFFSNLKDKYFDNDIIETPLDFEMASEDEMWLEESRRQFDQVVQYNKELDDKTKWLFTAFMSIITVIATIWGIAGLPENKWIPGVLLILSVIGLIFFWRIAKTTKLEILNIHGELLQIDKDDQKTDSKYQYKRLIIGFEYIIRQLKAYNETKANWHSLILIYVIIMIFFALVSLIFN